MLHTIGERLPGLSKKVTKQKSHNTAYAVRCLHQTSRARSRQREADAMWTTLFTVTFVIAAGAVYLAVLSQFD